MIKLMKTKIVFYCFCFILSILIRSDAISKHPVADSTCNTCAQGKEAVAKKTLPAGSTCADLDTAMKAKGYKGCTAAANSDAEKGSQDFSTSSEARDYAIKQKTIADAAIKSRNTAYALTGVTFFVSVAGIGLAAVLYKHKRRKWAGAVNKRPDFGEMPRLPRYNDNRSVGPRSKEDIKNLPRMYSNSDTNHHFMNRKHTMGESGLTSNNNNNNSHLDNNTSNYSHSSTTHDGHTFFHTSSHSNSSHNDNFYPTHNEMEKTSESKTKNGQKPASKDKNNTLSHNLPYTSITTNNNSGTNSSNSSTTIFHGFHPTSVGSKLVTQNGVKPTKKNSTINFNNNNNK